MIPDRYRRQVFQSAAQFLMIFVMGLSAFKGFSDLSWDAIYPSLMQGILGALGVWGVSKIGPRPTQ
jgi:hypothetical protein